MPEKQRSDILRAYWTLAVLDFTRRDAGKLELADCKSVPFLAFGKQRMFQFSIEFDSLVEWLSARCIVNPYMSKLLGVPPRTPDIVAFLRTRLQSPSSRCPRLGSGFVFPLHQTLTVCPRRLPLLVGFSHFERSFLPTVDSR